jgi:hypothetical protein
VTEEEIKELTGRELDAKVAEVLFGWVWLMHFTLNRAEIFSPQAVPHLCSEYYGWLPDNGNKRRMRSYDASEYSSTWPGLGLVVEEMQRRGYKLLVSSGTEERLWCASLDGPTSAEGWGTTAGEAVARAALLALGGDE